MTEQTNTDNVEFFCPNNGKIERDDVVFLCNNCEQSDVEYKNGMYMCPACLTPGENFQCMICDSKKVEMRFKKEKKK